jgi:hypothetical protein
MLDKFHEAIGLFSSNISLFSLIILTIWLPGNIVINYLGYYVFYGDDFSRLELVTVWIEWIFGPIYIGALIYALSRLKQYQMVTYTEAITVGFRNWGKLWRARFVAGLFVTLGLIALIVPGIILAIRYALIDSVVVLEGANASKSRKRSSELTAGKMWQIFGACVLFFSLSFIFAAMIYIPVGVMIELGFIGQLGSMIVCIVIDCILDVIYGILLIVMFLFYWDSKDDRQPLADETQLRTTLD